MHFIVLHTKTFAYSYRGISCCYIAYFRFYFFFTFIFFIVSRDGGHRYGCGIVVEQWRGGNHLHDDDDDNNDGGGDDVFVALLIRFLSFLCGFYFRIITSQTCSNARYICCLCLLLYFFLSSAVGKKPLYAHTHTWISWKYECVMCAWSCNK